MIQTTFKTYSISLGIAALVLFQLSCSVANKKKREVFTIATYDDVKDWDPATAFSLEVLPMANIYEPLLWYDAGSNPPRFIPALATEYFRSEDGLSWTFKLRENVFFHDGQPFDASSVKYVVDRNKTLNRGPSYIWSSVANIVVDNKYQISFTLHEPVPLDRIVSSQYGAWLYSPALIVSDISASQQVLASGTGPYKLKEWEQNSHILLEKNDNYWGGWEKNHFKKVIIKVVSEASTRLQMLKKGLADFAVLIPAHLLKGISQDSNLTISDYDSWINHFYLLNTKKFPTNNLWVRRAIASSFNRDILVDHIYSGTATKATGLLPQGLPLVSHPDSVIEYSIEKARSFLEKAGEPPESELELSYVSTSEEYRLTSLMMLDNLRKIGIKLRPKPGLWTANWDNAKNLETAPNIISMAWWPTLSSPSDWFYGLYKTEKEPLFNLAYYSNSAVDSLIDLAWVNESINPEMAADIYKQIQNILIDDCVAIPAVDLNIRSVYRFDIVGLKNNPAYSSLAIYGLQRRL